MRDMLARGWRAFRGWRRTRPFWAGLFGLLAAIAIVGPPVMSFDIGEIVITIATIGGMSALVISAVLGICAIGMWMRPEFRVPAGVLIFVVSLASLVTANLGGFMVGLFCGIVSAGLAMAWSPAVPAATPQEPITQELPVLAPPYPLPPHLPPAGGQAAPL